MNENSLPDIRMGFISPLDVMDTQVWELYRLAPPNVIGSFISLDIDSFTEAGVERCLDRKLAHCISTLLNRGADLMVMGAIPVELLMTPERKEQLLRSSDGTRFGTVGGFQSVCAAFETLAVERIAVANKWDAHVNACLDQELATRGFEVVSRATEVMAATDIKGSFESGADLAVQLARSADRDGSAECIWLAGGAWLTLPILQHLEDTLGKPVVALLPALNWYCLNRVGAYTPRTGMGALLETVCTSPTAVPHFV